MIGFGVGIGAFLSPGDANRYMQDWTREAGPGLYIESGSGRLFLLLLPLVSIDVTPLPWLRLQSISEVAIGPETITLNGERRDSRSFSFVRYSETLVANVEYPVDEARANRIFFGLGPAIHRLRFEEHRATTPGFRAQLGLGLLEDKVRAEGLIAFDYARARSERRHTWLDGEEGRFVLDYTSLHHDAIIHFNVVP
jgi:hypothetical protein